MYKNNNKNNLTCMCTNSNGPSFDHIKYDLNDMEYITKIEQAYFKIYYPFIKKMSQDILRAKNQSNDILILIIISTALILLNYFSLIKSFIFYLKRLIKS
ncbi:hypothetical protein HZS_7000 [Henneguya salminicola]|nr:hypothetical protein HZS_7000 [Henneguya salminicola]